jgi:NADH-quinone oxidoreductase subunit H
MLTSVILTLLALMIFPGFVFMAAAGMAGEFVDRKLYARLQNRMGPPWYQPLADFVKLLSKEELIPEVSDPFIFKAMPVLALAAAATSFIYVPIWGPSALYSFEGDSVVVLYLLTIPTLTFFLGGWYSKSLYAGIGSVRTLTQLFAYEVPLFMSIFATAILPGSWSLSKIAAFYSDHPGLSLCNLLGFGVAVVTLLGKLEKVPFDLPEAETEIVGGTFTEYSGKLYAFFRLTISVESGVAASLLAAVFLPWGLGFHPVVVFALYMVKVLFVFFLLALMRSLMARLRIEQMVDFCWKWLAPAALIQLLINVVLSGVITP